ncbi:hypothetical protein [Bradyrhizobium frederickii]|uniref:hypothetical protein n=1 Tax=Bradyrhizobium frederickii TaxID=2560054 RepID=UPI001F389B40|nr:hypothetical protein [Bradyrhizobium frederickii]
MRYVDVEISLRRLRRTDAADIAGDIGIEMQRDEVGEVAFVQPLGGQSLGAELVHGADCRFGGVSSFMPLSLRADDDIMPLFCPTEQPGRSFGQMIFAPNSSH